MQNWTFREGSGEKKEKEKQQECLIQSRRAQADKPEADISQIQIREGFCFL